MSHSLETQRFGHFRKAFLALLGNIGVFRASQSLETQSVGHFRKSFLALLGNLGDGGVLVLLMHIFE